MSEKTWTRKDLSELNDAAQVLLARNANLEAENKRLAREVAQWKADHHEAVRRKRVSNDAAKKAFAEIKRLKNPREANPERWAYLMSLKRADAIGTAFAMLEESILHHINERDGWTPDDLCYMETTQEARALIEAPTSRRLSSSPLPSSRTSTKEAE